MALDVIEKDMVGEQIYEEPDKDNLDKDILAKDKPEFRNIADSLLE